MKARLNRDFIYDILKQYVEELKTDTLFYTCGPVIYMDLCRFTLLGMGYADSQIKRRHFCCRKMKKMTMMKQKRK